MENESNTATDTKVAKTKHSPIPVKTNDSFETLAKLAELEESISKLSNSSIIKKNFSSTDADGNTTVNTSDVVSCIMLGQDMGLPPAVSINFGNRLNTNTYFSVLRGRELGLDPVTSMNQIYNIPTQNGNVLYLSIGVISKAIIDSGTEIHTLRDNAPSKTYKTVSGKYMGHHYNICNDAGKLNDNIFIYADGITPIDELKQANTDNKLILVPFGTTNVTSIRFVRKSNNINMVFHYSLQDAIDAGLHNGFHSSLIENDKPKYMKGKSNWNNHPTTHLRNRTLSIGGRIVVADKLQGGYTKEEAAEIANVEYVELEGDE